MAFLFSKDLGKAAENIVFIELKRRNYEVNYWHGAKEVDFIADDGKGHLQAINVSYTDELDLRETDGLKEFAQSNDAQLLLLTRDTEKEEEGIHFLPLWKWLLVNDQRLKSLACDSNSLSGRPL